MTFELGIAITATLCGVFGILVAWSSRAGYKHCNELLEFTGKQIENLEASLEESRLMRETDERKIKDQARRIAWLESRVRQPKTIKPKEEILPEATPVIDVLKTNMTERRHRVLTLAARGLSIDAIASTLGMMPGEVQLVMNLNRRQTNYAAV